MLSLSGLKKATGAALKRSSSVLIDAAVHLWKKLSIYVKTKGRK